MSRRKAAEVDSNVHHNGQVDANEGLQSARSQVTAPGLFHRVSHTSSILALVVSGDKIFAGSQEGEILVWSLETFALLDVVKAHRRSILCLCISDNEQMLFSSAGDAIINVWSTQTLEKLYSIYSTYDVGDVFCVAYSESLQTVYLGAQNTSIQWYDLKEKDARPPPTPTAHPFHRNHRFFDSKGPGGVSTPRLDGEGDELSLARNRHAQNLEIDKAHIAQYAHYGYVYCMLLVRGVGRQNAGEEVLVSGGGDGTIKLWQLDGKNSGAVCELAALENGDNSVLSLALSGSFLYCGLLEGDINVWDLDTMQLVRNVKAHVQDVLTVAIGGGFIFSGGASGHSKKFNQRHECLARWPTHDGLILASAVARYHDHYVYITGGNDNCVSVWDLSDCTLAPETGPKVSNEQLLECLAQFVSYKTVSSKRRSAEDCRRGATYLRSLFKGFGATTEMLNTDDDLNPIVFAKFSGQSRSRKRILFYGHYDVIAAEGDSRKWKTDPFTLQGVDGYLYGRGVSDNKGPILAALFAVADVVAEQTLDFDLVFLIEGEEESGSRGFEKAIKKNKKLIGDVDWIIVSNSYWLDDEVPCLTYGLRGVIHASLEVKSDQPDLHSGVDGSSLMDESLKDLVMLTSKLTGTQGQVMIPGFYDPILRVTAAEKRRYQAIVDTLIRRNPNLGDPASVTKRLMSRWREPSLTIHRLTVSGPEDNRTIIPRMARASFSLRLVNNQDLHKTKGSLIKFLEKEFAKLKSGNQLCISIDHEAEPWLGDPDNEIYQTLEAAVVGAWKDVLGTQKKDRRGPLYIREGGSIPSIPFLEKEFGAPVAQFPCGQASDNAHLDNERLRVLNLYKAREIFGRVFRELGNR